MSHHFGLTAPVRAVIIGGRGGIGAAFTAAVLADHPDNTVLATSRDPAWVAEHLAPRAARRRVDITAEADVEALAAHITTEGWAPNLIINTAGLLHDGSLQPERTIRRLDPADLRRSFDVNALGVALLLKHLLPLVPRKERAVIASLSARIGSIGDNRLGGWYSYRAAKAAQNMLLKTASIEAKRRWPELIVAALHPGTVASELSAPFQRSVPAHKLFAPEHAVAQLSAVISGLRAENSGEFYAYDGEPIEW